jgi:Skp family chaperone for outer membrane proteins
MKRLTILTMLLGFLLAVASAGAEPNTVIGFYHLPTVLERYFAESQSFQRIQQLRNELVTRKGDVEREILDLERDLADALADDDAVEADDLRAQIERKREEAVVLAKVYDGQIQQLENETTNSSSFNTRLRRALEQVGLTGGFAALLPVPDAGMYWYSLENMVTQDVLDALEQLN